MLQIKWTDEARYEDLPRLMRYKAASSGDEAANDLAYGLITFIDTLPDNPRVWRQMKQFTEEVRRAFWDSYEVRYEIDEVAGLLIVLRLFSQREDRET